MQDGGYSEDFKEGKMSYHSEANLKLVVRAFLEGVRKINLNSLSEDDSNENWHHKAQIA